MTEHPIKGEIYSLERLEEYAAYLATQLKMSESSRKAKLLLPRMRENGVKLREAYRSLTEASRRKEPISPAGEWLIDNFHIVEDQLREIQEDLPPAFYKELPKIALGELAGYPRIYAIALALVAHTDSQLEAGTIRRFVLSYQKVSPLKIGELWALAITLRLVLVENLRRIVLSVVRDHDRRNEANHFADKLLDAAGDQDKFNALLSQLSTLCPDPVNDDCAFTAQFAKRLRDQDPHLFPALEYFEKQLSQANSSIEQRVHASHQTQAANQVSVANIITSMRLLSSLNWRDFFESISLVDDILESDPVYEQMDFPTRDRYRHVLERIGKRCHASEIDLAHAIVDLAQKSKARDPDDARKSHVGYYLIGHGVSDLHKNLGFRRAVGFFGFMLSHPNLVYFGTIGFILALILAPPLYYAIAQGISLASVFTIGLLILIPCSDLALGLGNLILTHLIRPKVLPKLDFSLGLPPGCKAMVVVPCMLTSHDTISELLEKIEIHFLGNSDEHIFFALLTDFVDANSESAPDDAGYLQALLDGIAKLNLKYAANREHRFFAFHRRRKWNPAEGVWMGWERKRGKLHEFNLVLRGNPETSFDTVTAPASLLPSIRYVITLDADTQMPRDSAKRMIGTIMHPLNQPHFDPVLGRVTEGHGILQPRIGISLESSSRSYFSQIFSGSTGVDPYTTAVSDVYQDLFFEGSYTGKGLYDVDAFEAALDNRIPENTILSHDLFEGLYARAGLVTDVEFLDDYPLGYHDSFVRQHRWVRGDWQIAAWILPFVPFVQNGRKKWVRNHLSLISRWKILDNLRRSLVAPMTFLWFILAWAALPGSPLVWSLFALSLSLVPCFVQGTAALIAHNFGKPTARMAATSVRTKFSLLQALFSITFLAHQCYIQLDAILRVTYRQLISKQKLLEWTTAAQAKSQTFKKKRPIWQEPWLVEGLLLCAGLFLIALSPPMLALALVYIALWMSYPLVSSWLSYRRVRETKALTTDGRRLLRQIARRTWNYFETFVGADDNWLPPDNHQESPLPVTAHRTSPTNIGLYLLSLQSARDFGYVSVAKFISRLGLTLASLEKLEHYKGHYYNWYDTRSLEPLNPKYVSTVDSGNLAAFFLPARQACFEIASTSVIDAKCLDGLRDTFLVIDSEVGRMKSSSTELRALFVGAQAFLNQTADRVDKPTPVQPKPQSLSEVNAILKSVARSLESAKVHMLNFKSAHPEKESRHLLTWIEIALCQTADLQNDALLFAPWLNEKFADLGSRIEKQSPTRFLQWKDALHIFDQNPSIAALAQAYDSTLAKFQVLMADLPDSSPLKPDLADLLLAIKNSKDSADRLLQDAAAAARSIDQKFEDMNFSFLLDKQREVFSIGYSVTDGRADNGFYDLLGSESRLASFIAIAKGEVPQEHWFRLGRQLVSTSGGRALVSWTASMFEYLMPLLVMRDYENTLLDETMHAVVTRQIKYGNEHRVPWGISEAGFNARDLQMNYQYGPFGIPGLGLKRGLSNDLVISPYSTVLAAQVNPMAALENMKRLIGDHLLTDHGFYESIDYTPGRLQGNQKFAVIKSHMAHHQGMSLVALNNVLNDNIMQDRFHSDPRVRATRLLLQERIPQGITAASPQAAEIEIEAPRLMLTSSFSRHYSDPNASSPRIQLLSNRTYSLMITTAGGGYSKCRNLAVSRWREDATLDNWGSYIFVRDQAANKVWSTTYQPFTEMPELYRVTMGEDQVEFRRRDGDISSYMQILVAPEDNVEIRHVTLTNHSNMPRVLELTSYLEPVLGSSAADLDHPAFSKLFVQTEFLSSKKALLAKRRQQSGHDQENWGLHVVVTDGKVMSEIQYETDRAQFIGRGRNLSNPYAMLEGENLSNVAGETLDPILSLRVQVLVPAGSKIHVAFSTGLASSREEALEWADRYHDIHCFERESKMSWTKCQADLRHLGIEAEAADLYQSMAKRILFMAPPIGPSLQKSTTFSNAQTSLWPSGISGDLPIVIVRIKDQADAAVVRTLLRCHEYLRLKGLAYDFLILNEHKATYFQGLQDELEQQIRTTGSQGWLNKPGGVFILRCDLMPEKDVAYIKAVARVSLVADEPLKEQINRKVPGETELPAMTFNGLLTQDPVAKAQALKLDFFNTLGGFSPDGREYVIALQAGKWTPAPWLNVIGNKRGFGFQVSETGSGFTWAINSQANRLTPWSNDPVSDPPGEMIYLRDDDTGELWNPTPLPIRGDAPYTIRHGQGYSVFEHTGFGIQTELTLFVPKDETVKISLLRIKNLTKRRRKISVVSYTEWVLGTRREKTSPHVICEVDQKSGVISARNPNDGEFGLQVAFADFNLTERTFTCSRKEFLGRNGNHRHPAALLRTGLSRKTATGQDPCAALQGSISLKAGEEREISITLGQCENTQQAVALALRYRDLALVHSALREVTAWWDQLLGTIQIKTPEPAMNLLMNRWLVYQTLSCRYWSRTAFYQSGGAFGFRDQLQDMMALVYSAPDIAREHILRASGRQFKEGDVQHWWHPPTGRGVRTRISDDLLWLPYVVSFYIRLTGDHSILRETAPFLEAPLLKDEQEDSYSLPAVSSESATVLEHCLRTLNKSLTTGEHGLPLIGTGDWNDGMNRVGPKGKGESVWMGWFLYRVLNDFLPFCEQPAARATYEAHMNKLKESLDSGGWDAEWYKRAYFDDGTPIGSATSEDCKIDSISQTWAVLSGAGAPDKVKQAMSKVSELLVRDKDQLVLLLTPPFDKGPKDPGYIKGYIPSVRENGGQYTHAATWVVMAFAELGDGDRAFDIFKMLNPIMHAQSEAELRKYRIEPYAIAGDVYEGSAYQGRGGWSWYTGSASWYYRSGLESILGFRLAGNQLKISPCIPKTWKSYEISYVFGKSRYVIQVNNPEGLSTGRCLMDVDGIRLQGSDINLVDDGKDHQVEVTIQSQVSAKSEVHLYSDQSAL